MIETLRAHFYDTYNYRELIFS